MSTPTPPNLVILYYCKEPLFIYESVVKRLVFRRGQHLTPEEFIAVVNANASYEALLMLDRTGSDN